MNDENIYYCLKCKSQKALDQVQQLWKHRYDLTIGRLTSMRLNLFACKQCGEVVQVNVRPAAMDTREVW